MPECFICGKEVKSVKKYYGLTICKNCYDKVGLTGLKTIDSDPYLEKLISSEDRQHITALNTFASSFSKDFSKDLIGMCLVSLKDKEEDALILYSFIIGARSVLLFGADDKKTAEINELKLDFLVELANIVDISIISKIGKRYIAMGLDMDDEEIDYDIEGELSMIMIGILNEMRYRNTDNELRERILALYSEIMELELEEEAE